MRVLQINVTFGVGSTGRIVQDIHNHLLSQGIESSVIYGRTKKFNHSNVYYIGSIFSLYLDAFLTRVTGLVGYFSFLSTLRIIHQIKKLNPDIIHLHNIHGYFLNIPIFLSFLVKFDKKNIWTFHDEFMYTGKCAYAQDCVKFQSQCQNCPLVKEYPKSSFFDWSKPMHSHKKRMLLRLNDLTIVTPSTWLANRVKSSFLRDYEIFVINNGINTDVFRPQANKSIRGKDDKLIILSLIAKLDDERKGHHWIPQIAEKISDLNVEFVIVGSGFKRFNRENIKYIERTSNVTELVSLYQNADLFLILSEHENYPTVCLEASSVGIPVVGFNVGGVEEAIGNVYYKLLEYGDMKISDTIRSYYFSSKGAFTAPKLLELDYGVMTTKYSALYMENNNV